MIETNKDGYIINYCGATLEHRLIGKFGRYQYKTSSTGIPVYSPQPYTPEQTEQLRKEWCQAEIQKLYPADKEAKILRKMLTGDSKDFTEYNKAIEAIIKESKEKDFQIKNGG